MASRWIWIAGAVVAAVAAAGPFVFSGGPAAPDPDPYERFVAEVVPVLDRRCGGCHGMSPEAYPAFDEEPANAALLRWIVDGEGRAATPEQQRLAYRQCTTERRTASRTFTPIDRRYPAAASLLIRAPLAESYSGHARHPEVFPSPEDPDYRALQRWIELERRTAPEPDAPLTGPEAYFADRVVPVLRRKGCFATNCHGPLAFNDLKLDAGVPLLEDEFTAEQHRQNRQAMLGAVTRLVNLSGDVSASKQLLKIIPVADGGILHKGGNDFVRKGDPDYDVLEEWLRIEAQEAWRRTGRGDAAPATDGFVFVRRPRATPERFFEDQRFLGGGDLVWRRDAGETNLTADLHPGGPADIRSPDVSYDGRHVVFAMRRTADEPFNLWEIGLESGEARQLTFSTRPDEHFLDPLYVPDPQDGSGDRLEAADLVFVSNRAGAQCASSPEELLGEAEGGTRQVIVDEQLTLRPGALDGRLVRIVRGPGAGEVRRVVRQDVGRMSLDRPLPAGVTAATHYAVEAGARTAPCYDAYRMKRAAAGAEREVFEATLSRLTYSNQQIRRPAMRSSGEVMYTALRTGYQAGRPFFNGAVFRTHPDGSNFHTHNGNRSGVPIHADNRELVTGLEIRIGRDADSYWGGMPILSDHQFGPSIEPFNPLDDLDHPYRDGPPVSSEPRFLPGWIPLDPAASVRGLSEGGAYRDPYPLPDGSIVVSYAEGPLDLSDPAAAPDFDVVRLVPEPSFHSAGGLDAGRFRRETLIEGPESELWPRPVRPRLKEPLTKALLRDERRFGRPGAIGGLLAYPEGTPAVLQLSDLPLLAAFFEQIAPVGRRHLALPVCPICGRETPEIDRIDAARIIGAAGDDRFVIAEVPLEPDGSFATVVPAGVSFDVQALNGLGMALSSPMRWLYARPGEIHTLSIPRTLYPQTCSGCHGGLSGRPEDTLRRPDAMTSASHTLANWHAERYESRAPANLSADDRRELRPLSFATDVRPILERRCTACHSTARPAGGLRLDGSLASASLLALVEWREGRAIRSYLVEKLLGRELHSPRPLSGDAPHPSADPLPNEAVRTIIRWIDAGVPE